MTVALGACSSSETAVDTASSSGAPVSPPCTTPVCTTLPPGITFGPDDKLYFADKVGSRILRIDPL